MRIYLDNAATTPMHPDVMETMLAVMRDDFGNPSSIHKHGRSSKAIVEQARKTVAKIINASIGEVFFTSSATEANNMVLKNAVLDLDIKRIISSHTEHPCILESLAFIKHNFEIAIEFVGVDHQGHIDLEQLEQLLANSEIKTLVSIMHVNNEIGTMSDITLIGAMCKNYNAIYHCDAVQSVGKYAIDVQASNIQFLSGSAHKFQGPKGVGFVMISNDYMLSPFIHGGAQERNMRAGTENVAGIAGLAKALQLGYDDRLEVNEYIVGLRNYLKEQFETTGIDIQYNGDQSENFAAHILSVSFPPGPKADMLVMNLDIAGISASSASACSAGIEEDSHVMKAIGHDTDRKTIRFSFSRFNTKEEIDYLVEKVKGMM
jgi:cysteine desulfurase